MSRLAVLLLGNAPFGSCSLPPHREMRSDGRFMEKDYPSDVRARVTSHHTKYDFDHPYPILQEDHDYDADYVKDENEDGGEWQAQETYDYLRHVIAGSKAEVERLKRLLKEHERIYKDAQAKAGQHSAGSDAGDAAFNEAKKAADSAQDRLDDLKAQVADAQGALQKEKNEVEECRNELQIAKKNLETRMDKQREKEEKAEAVHAKATRRTSTRADREKETGREEAEKEATDEVEQAEDAEDFSEHAVEKEKTEMRLAQEAYDAAVAKVKRTEALLEEAAAKLKRYRDREDPNGGVYNANFVAQKAAAHGSTMALVPFILAVSTMMSIV